jgi:hypothetical protein
MIGLIHRSLEQGRAVVAGTTDHAFLVYGAEYDRNGSPLSYRIKDSLAPFVYRERADELHASLNDVTVWRSDSAGASLSPIGLVGQGEWAKPGERAISPHLDIFPAQFIEAYRTYLR